MKSSEGFVPCETDAMPLFVGGEVRGTLVGSGKRMIGTVVAVKWWTQPLAALVPLVGWFWPSAAARLSDVVMSGVTVNIEWEED